MNRPRFLARPSQRRPGDSRQTGLPLVASMVRTCRLCGCTDNDCRQCIAKTGGPCWWVAPDLCSACEAPKEAA
jgi:hypothetical protein